MKTEVRIYTSPKINPSELYKLKVAIQRKQVKVIWLWYQSDDEIAREVSILNKAFVTQLLAKGGQLTDLDQPVMICGEGTSGFVNEIYVGAQEILAVL